jgi:hypothetical protein
MSSLFPDDIIVRIVVDRGLAELGCLGDRLTYPPPLTPPRYAADKKYLLSTLNSKLES